MNNNITINKLEIQVNKGGQLNFADDNGFIQSEQNNYSEQEKSDVEQIVKAFNNQEYSLNSDKAENYGCRALTEEDVCDFPAYIIKEFRRQLGTRVDGDKSNLQVLGAFLNEMEDTLQNNKKFGVMPIFAEVPRKEEKGYLYLDDCIMPLDDVKVAIYYWDAFEKYIIDSKYYHILIGMHDNNLAYFELGYKLHFADVSERLLGFSRAEKLVNSEKIRLLLTNENRSIEVNTSALGKDRETQIEKTKYWIEQMKKINSIENYYRIKFYLPKKAGEKDYQTIDILSSSLNKISNATLPGIPFEKTIFKKSIKITDEIFINGGETFPELTLFGYCFKPISVYLTECTLIWKKKVGIWETSKGGVPVRVDFTCNRM